MFFSLFIITKIPAPVIYTQDFTDTIYEIIRIKLADSPYMASVFSVSKGNPTMNVH